MSVGSILSHLDATHPPAGLRMTCRPPLTVTHNLPSPFLTASSQWLTPLLCSLQKDELYLNLVLEYVPETVYRVARHFTKAKLTIPIIYVKVGRWAACGEPPPPSLLGLCTPRACYLCPLSKEKELARH